MAVQNLDIAVDVDISKAVSKLRELQNELEDLSEKISQVDARGAEGIDIATSVDQLDTELAALEGQIQAFEAANSIDVATGVDGANFGGQGGATGGDFMGVDVMNVLARNVNIASGGGLGGFGGGGGGGGMNFPGGMGGGRDVDFDLDTPSRPRLGSGGGFDADQALFNFVGSIKESIGRVDDFKLRMSDLHNLVAALIPLLLVFIGAIPAAVTALLTLAAAAISAAAAFLAIGGFGALGFAMEDGQFDAERLQEVAEDVRDDFLEAFAPLSERLQPLFEDAIDGLETFFQDIANQGDALVSLTDEARAFGRFITEFVPDSLRTLAALVNSLAPVFGLLGDYLRSNFNGIVRTFLEITLEALPALIRLTKNIVGVLRFLAKMGAGFAVVSSMILEFLGSISLLLKFLGVTDEDLGLLIGSLFALASAAALTSTIIGSYVGSLIAAKVATMQAFFANMILRSSILGGVVSAMAKGIVAISGWIASLLGASGAQLSFATATLIASGALAGFLTLASLGVLAGLSSVALKLVSDFLGVADSIDAASSSMRDFNRVSGRTGTDGFNPYGGAPDSGAAGAGGLGATRGGSTTINVESTGDKNQDKSNVQKISWYQGRNAGTRR